MKFCTSIQFKATLLTFVFLLNTIVGFACAVGAERGLSSEHSHHEHEQGHVHQQAAEDHHSAEDHKDNCCKDEVAKFIKADKIDLRNFDYSLLSLSFFVLPITVFHIGDLSTFPINTPNAYFDRHCRSPIQDIRIAIQSFQI